ncbi:sterol desaturase family protein [Hyphococcus flavus]|uniref:Sterol desaturase family protein n=1 Tax=Hyphococcus flavus TaxID=1866326 RepID=A0AAE9ZDS6_9PROT|nr:sterol desaturase family protein [Hyphococcus flavus]WDI32701.1 sterol desaturase family protein [Hyphococcus flavus]
MRLFIGYKAWKEEEYLLNRMTFDDLVKAYVTYPAIQVYALIVLVALITGFATMTSLTLFAVAFVVGALMFPVAWYLIHRFVLHGSWMYKTPYLASLWKRVHYDHHRFPNDLSVLFGGLHTTLPTILFAAGPVGWWINGLSGACAAIAGTVVMTCYTEFLHAGQHLAFEPKSKFWKTIKARHLAHHFHNESGNFGIAEFFWDKAFGTFYAETADAPRSATARNLGYTDETAKKFPWVKELTDAEPEKRQAMRSRGAA